MKSLSFSLNDLYIMILKDHCSVIGRQVINQKKEISYHVTLYNEKGEECYMFKLKPDASNKVLGLSREHFYIKE